MIFLKLGALVSIVCNFFNHEKFAKQAIESFLMQKTDFEFEILLHDDASTDGTREIVSKYAKEFPDKISAIVQQENKGQKGINIWMLYQFPRAKGKYIALCDGDDYWIDPYKLQKQVNVFRNDPDCSLTFHNTLEVTVEKSTLKYIQNLKERFYIQDFVHFFYARTVSMVFRNPEQDWPKQFQNMRIGDWPVAIWLMQYGCARYIPEVMAAYRIHDGGVYTTWNSNKKAIHVFESFLLLSKTMGIEYKQLVFEKVSELSFSYFFGSLRTFYFKGIIIGFWQILVCPNSLKITKFQSLFSNK